MLCWSAGQQNQSLARPRIFNPGKAAANFCTDHYCAINITCWLPFPNKLIVMPWLAPRSTLHHKCSARGLWTWAAMSKPSPAWRFSRDNLWTEGKPTLGVPSTRASSTVWNLSYHHTATPGVERFPRSPVSHLPTLCRRPGSSKASWTALGTRVRAAEPAPGGSRGLVEGSNYMSTGF